ncbi:MAG: hypothetical protein WA001_02120 [Patescibacteria group bacterium]
MKNDASDAKPEPQTLTFTLDLPRDVYERLMLEAEVKYNGALPKLVAEVLIAHAAPRPSRPPRLGRMPSD